jgi:O-antigen/teichoic acid export membrane protein
MASTTGGTFRERVGMLRTQLGGIVANRQILANASALMGTMLITSGVGALYWLIAARLFDAEAVGLAGTSISTMTLLGTAGMLGLGTLLIGELPRRPGEEGVLIATGLLIAGLTGFVCSVGFAIAAPLISPNLGALTGSPAQVALFALGVSITSVTMVLDQALIGLLKGGLQLWRNASFAVIKLLVLIGIALWLGGGDWGTIYWTWIIGNLLSLVWLLALGTRRGIWQQPGLLRPRWLLLRQFGRRALGHHFLNMALQLPGLALPILVTSLLSATASAYYYVASIVSGPFFYGTLALVTALYAVGSRSPEALAQRMRFTLSIALAAAIAANLVLLVGADRLLGLFGRGYAAEAGWTLRLLALCIFPIIIKDHFVTLSRIHGRFTSAALLISAGSVTELGFAAIGALVGGLPGLVLGWFAAQSIEALIMAPTVFRAARGVAILPPDEHPTPPSPGLPLGEIHTAG